MPQELAHQLQCTLGVAQSVRDTLGVIPTWCGIVPEKIRTIKVLGRGRAAEARLVSVTVAGGATKQCVEKVFRPALLTRAIYRIAFQAPFAYQSCQHAILASFYRRRVAAAIVEAMGQGCRVAEPYYVRWDAESQAYVLASEFVPGRGIVPAPLDSFSVRRFLSRCFRRQRNFPDRPHDEINNLLECMSRLEALFRDCGLEGSGWQVCKRAMVSTANLLHTPTGYVVVDLESGIPAVLVPSYVLGAMRLGAVPPFDDVDASRLRPWLADHANLLEQRLGAARVHDLRDDAERLIAHSDAWKQSELAVGRNKWRVLGRGCRSQFKARCLEIWSRRGIIDEATRRSIEPGRRIFTRLTFLFGLFPGAVGRFLQRVAGNRGYRDRIGQFMCDSKFRCEQLANFAARYSRRWQLAGRIGPEQRFDTVGLMFLLNCLLAVVLPAGMHRWISDPVQRRNVLIRMCLICVSARFQSEYGRYLIRSWIRQWETAGRLTLRDAMQLRRQLSASDMDEYVRCFGMHMGLKLLLPLLTPLKYGGGAMSVLSGNLWFLFFFLLMPACRTAITIWRMLASKRPFSDYVDALLVGILPVIGSLAYPVQMYSRYRELSAFLLRDSAARLGRWIPIYGGKDSRVEIAAIKSVNLVAECLEVGLAGTAPLRRRLGPVVEEVEGELQTIEISTGRWNRLAQEQLRLIAASEAAAESAASLTSDRTPDSYPVRVA